MTANNDNTKENQQPAENAENENRQQAAPEKKAAQKPAKGGKHEKSTQKKAPDHHAELAAARQQAAAAQEKADEIKGTLLRTVAEYDNYRKRTQKEQEMSFQHGVAHAAEALLPVLDTLETAVKAPTADEEFKKGVVLTLSKATEVFEKLGISEIDALNQPFDPNLHNAVLQQPAEGAESGMVTQVVQKGYTLNGRVIRHAMVAVAP